MMHYAKIRPFDVANGPGIRVSLFVCGCTQACPNCFNELYQDFNYGLTWNEVAQAQLLKALSHPQVAGLTLLGGEPLQNEGALYPVLKQLKRALQEKHLIRDIWIYSGLTFEEALEHPAKRNVLELCDVLVDGRFVEALKDVRLTFRGSSNQRILNLPNSLRVDQAVWEQGYAPLET